MKPRIFVGSSSENIRVAQALQQNLQNEADVTIWNQGIFELSRSTLESLIEALGSFDFSIFVFTPDDILQIRGAQYSSTRDNVMFELGLFMGHLGRGRAFFLQPRGIKDFHLLSDLLGMTPATYDPDRLKEN